MANRRMFSKAVVGSARFLKMPTDSQNLYFHLGMAADDDGVVEAWSVLRAVGSAEDNLRVLASKGFVKVLNDDLVSYILDWNEHNAMRSDRLTPSSYRELLVQVLPEVELVVPTQRADRMKRLGRPTDVPGAPQDRIGEDRIGNIGALEDEPRMEYVITSEEDAPAKKEKDPMLEKCALWWHKKCKEETGLAPSGGLVKTKGIIKNARKSLTYPEIQEMMTAWFENSSLEPHETIQITRCLSSFQIDKYLAENL